MRNYAMHSIQLAGAGLVKPANKVYGPGEYSDLTNAEIIVPENVVRGRRPIRKLGVSGTNYSNMVSALGRTGKFIGAHDDSAVISNKTSSTAENHAMYLVNDTSRTVLWNWGSGFHDNVMEGYLQYGGNSYWVTRNTVTGNTEIFHGPSVTTAFGSLTKTVVADVPGGSDFKELFMFKDRLFILTDKTIYYSTSLTPTDFTPALGKGGAIKVTDDVIKHAFAYRDIVYILSQSSIYSFSFNIDPLSDGVFSKITSEVGGSYGTVYQSIPYVVNPTGLYSILNNYVEKVVDIAVESSDVSTLSREYKIVAWDDSIFIIKQGINDTMAKKDAILVYNVLSRSLSRLSYVDRGTEATVNNQVGFIQDAINIQTGPGRNEETILFATHSQLGTNGTHIYRMTADRVSTLNQRPWDDYYDSAGVAQLKGIKCEVNLDNIVPDGLEWVIKKFRHLFFEGKIPIGAQGNLKAGFSEDSTTTRDVTLTESAAQGTKTQYPRPYRMNLMQRGNALFLRFIVPSDATMQGDEVGVFELSNIKILWTPTARSLHEAIGDGSAN